MFAILGRTARRFGAGPVAVAAALRAPGGAARFASASLEQLKQLRARTGAKVVDCKRTLDECGGDVEEAVRRLGEAAAAAGEGAAARDASEGRVCVAVASGDGGSGAALVDVSSATDFVARNELLREGGEAIARACVGWRLAEGAAGGGAAAELTAEQLERIGASPGEGDAQGLVARTTSELAFKFGEPVAVRRAAVCAVPAGAAALGVGAYAHGHGKYAAAVALEGAGADAAALERCARDVAVHVVAASPSALAPLADQGGAAAPRAGAADLHSQPFALDEDKSVGQWLRERAREVGGDIRVRAFIRLQVGGELESAVAE